MISKNLIIKMNIDIDLKILERTDGGLKR